MGLSCQRKPSKRLPQVFTSVSTPFFTAPLNTGGETQEESSPRVSPQENADLCVSAFLRREDRRACRPLSSCVSPLQPVYPSTVPGSFFCGSPAFFSLAAKENKKVFRSNFSLFIVDGVDSFLFKLIYCGKKGRHLSLVGLKWRG